MPAQVRRSFDHEIGASLLHLEGEARAVGADGQGLGTDVLLKRV